MTGVLTPPRCGAAEPWATGTPIEATVTAGPIADALARQESMLVPQTAQRFVVLDGPLTTHPTADLHDLALFSVLPLAAPTTPVPLVGAAFDQVHRLASIALQPLVAPTATATYLPPLRIPHRYARFEPRIVPVPRSRAYRAFTELTAWLGMTQEETATLLGIGRTTPLAWRRGHEPQPARARRLFQTHALVKTLVRRLGTDEARRWLGRGTPSPLELLLRQCRGRGRSRRGDDLWCRGAVPLGRVGRQRRDATDPCARPRGGGDPAARSPPRPPAAVIDRHIKAPWPPEVAEALAHFRQGDLIERPPFFYGRHATIEIFDAGGLAEEESQVHEVHPDDAPPYGIITTQTCDLDERGTPTQPWIQVSPVYPLKGDEPPRKAYLVELTGPAGKASSQTCASSCHWRRACLPGACRSAASRPRSRRTPSAAPRHPTRASRAGQRAGRHRHPPDRQAQVQQQGKVTAGLGPALAPGPADRGWHATEARRCAPPRAEHGPAQRASARVVRRLGGHHARRGRGRRYHAVDDAPPRRYEHGRPARRPPRPAGSLNLRRRQSKPYTGASSTRARSLELGVLFSRKPNPPPKPSPGSISSRTVSSKDWPLSHPEGGGRPHRGVRRTGRGDLRDGVRSPRTGCDPRGGRAHQARGEHLPLGQHRARQRTRDAHRPHGHRHLGGRRRGADLRYHNPHVPVLPDHGLSSIPLEEALQDADLVLIVTAHSGVDHDTVLTRAEGRTEIQVPRVGV